MRPDIVDASLRIAGKGTRMNRGYPVYTADAECQDCFKCVRRCPVKAIEVRDSHASVIPESCIACGNCVEVCPVHAKKIRNDLSVVQGLLAGQDPVYVSLAPSWTSEFPGIPAERIIACLKRLGFAGVSETALGAQIVSDALAEEMKEFHRGLKISSACPAVVSFLCRHMPEFAPNIARTLSPAQSHAKLLKERFGENVRVVFVGPCIAKMNESDRRPDLLSAAILFSQLRQLLREKRLDPFRIETTPDDVFLPHSAREGVVYPVEGGMNETIRMHGGCDHVAWVALSGIPALRQALNGLNPDELTEPVFLEALACVGGCVHGPGTNHAEAGLLERLRVLRGAELSGPRPEKNPPKIDADFPKEPIAAQEFSLSQLHDALLLVGKRTEKDELNCGGCGYDTCRNFARALLSGKAEPNMCVSYMRNLAQKKSNAILRCIPAAVAIADSKLSLVESNKRFAELCGEAGLQIWDVMPGMAGASLEALIPELAGFFREAILSHEELSRDMIRIGKRLYSLDIFNIDPGQVVGAMLFDVTKTEFRREQIAARAREVIRKNLATVQDIACKLGEHMADTEILLRSIADNYADAPADSGQEKDRA